MELVATFGLGVTVGFLEEAHETLLGDFRIVLVVAVGSVGLYDFAEVQVGNGHHAVVGAFYLGIDKVELDFGWLDGRSGDSHAVDLLLADECLLAELPQ